MSFSSVNHSNSGEVAREQDIRIFVATHKPAACFESEILQPIQVGAALGGPRLAGALRDDEGESISEKNLQYCELTAQYWAWKNTSSEYVGFCHYRRYFDFGAARHAENVWGEVLDDLIDEEAQQLYGLDDASIRANVEGFDVITTEFKDLRSFPGSFGNPVEHWLDAPALSGDDLYAMLAILVARHPDYASDVEAYATGNSSCFCNMFVMRRAIFDDYCEWLFPLLDEFCESWDTSRCSVEMLRTPGHLAERLLNIYLLHHDRIGAGWKTKQVQCVHFVNPEPEGAPLPPAPEVTQGKPIVPVVFAADENYMPMLAVTIHSMLANASRACHYDITVLTTDISPRTKRFMMEFFSASDCATLRFYNVWHLLRNYKLETNNEHIGVETYYRFLVQDILPLYDKVLYLDSDLIIEGDVAELYATDLGDNLVGAVRDVDFIGNLNKKEMGRLEYAIDFLGMENPYDYFQAGVLVLNTAGLRAEVPVERWLADAQDTRYIYNDQDILNARLEGRVTFLDAAWNVMHDGWERIAIACSKAPKALFDEYLDARTREKVIHYAGSEKPWNCVDCDRRERYWHYARQTPFYEQLVATLARDSAAQVERKRKQILLDKPVVSEESPWRKLADPLLPYDSRRRELARSVVQRIKGLK